MTRPASAESGTAAAAAEPAIASGARRSTRSRAADVPIAIWLITALWASLLLGASLLWPMTYGYDEPQHVDMAYVYSAHPFHFYGSGQLQMTEASIGTQRLLPGYPPGKRFASIAPTPRPDRPSLADLGGHTPSKSRQPNQMVQHPPLYYWAEAVVLRLPGVSHLAWDMQIWLMRLLSVLFLLPVPLLCWVAARRLLTASVPAPTASRIALVAAVIPLTIPNLIRDGSAVTNDSLLILTTSALIYLLCRVMTGDLTRRTATWVAVSLAAALLTKGFALSYPPLVLFAYLVGSRSARADDDHAPLRRIAAPLGIAAVGGVVGGLWWLRNVVDYHAVQIDGFGMRFRVATFGTPDNAGTYRAFVPKYIREVTSRIWGGVGLPDAPSTGPVIVYGWFYAALLGVLVALVVRGARDDRWRAWVLILFPVLSLVVAAAGSFREYHKWSHTLHGAQGRYIYHVIVAVAVLVVLGWELLLRSRLVITRAMLVLVAAIVTNAVAWLMLLRNWYQPKGAGSLHGLRDAIGGLVRWSPVPAGVTIALVLVLPAVLSIAAIWSVLTSRAADGVLSRT